jgi:UDP-N-acetylmuramoyl-tripeptide--D-alanyl-D-alanine ligase
MTNVYLFIGFLLLLFAYLLFLKNTLEWLYLWQKKEYRLDKMWDYLSTLEGQKISFNKWTKLRIIWLLILIFYFAFLITVQIRNLDFSHFHYRLQLFLMLLNLVFWLFEIMVWKKKVIARNVLTPEITLKAGLILVASLITLIGLQFYSLEVFQSDLALILVFNLIILFIPAIVGYWILLFFPADYFIKSNIFKKARIHRESLQNLKVIAISGAYGKTGSKEILAHFLSQKYQVAKTLKNQNSNMSCAKKTLTLKPEDNFFICELGAYKIGDGSEICQFIRPNISLISGINLQHYALFKSKENILKAETESLRFLKKDDLAVVNYNSQINREIQFPVGIKLIKYGVIDIENDLDESMFDTAIKILEINDKGTLFELILNPSHLSEKSQKIKIQTNLIGQGNLENLAGAISVSLANNLEIEDIKEFINQIPEFETTLKIQDKKWGKLINDTYNANFDGVKNGIKILNDLQKIKSKDKIKYESVLFLDDILELGEKSESTHNELADFILENDVDRVVLLGRSFKQIIQKRLLEKGFDKEKILTWNENNQLEIVKEIEKLKYKVILLAGYQARKFVNYYEE